MTQIHFAMKNGKAVFEQQLYTYQLELFPENDIVRFAMSFSTHEFGRLKTSSPRNYERISIIRDLVHKHNDMVRSMEKRLARDLERLSV